MKVKIDNGQATFSFFRAYLGKDNCASGHETGLQIQLYWPKIKMFFNKECRNHREFFMNFTTCLRVVTENNYTGFGFQILGFGFAADYQSE